MCLAQGHNAVAPVRLEPVDPWSQVKHTTTEPLHSQYLNLCDIRIYYECEGGIEKSASGSLFGIMRIAEGWQMVYEREEFFNGPFTQMMDSFSCSPLNSTFRPWHEIYNNLVCATSKASDQHAHTHSLIRTFASR